MVNKNRINVLFIHVIISIWTIFVLAGCASIEQKLSDRSEECFEQYNACYSSVDVNCLTHILDSATLSYYQLIIDAAQTDDENSLLPFIKKMRFKRLTAFYTYLAYFAQKEGDIVINDVGHFFDFLKESEVLGHDLAHGRFGYIDRIEEDRVWGYALFDESHKKRLEFVPDGEGMKFSWIYRNSLFNYRLYEGKYDYTSIKHVVSDLFEFKDEQSIVQFNSMINRMELY